MTKFDFDTLRPLCKSIFDHWRKAGKTDTNTFLKQIKDKKSPPIKLIGNQHAIKTFERFTCTNTTPINNIISHIHTYTQTFRVFLLLLLNIVGLSTKYLTKDTFLFNFTYNNIFFSNSFSNKNYVAPLN